MSQTCRGSFIFYSNKHQIWPVVWNFWNPFSLIVALYRIWQRVLEKLHTVSSETPLRDGRLQNVKRELLQHKSKFCFLTTCNHLTAGSPSLSLACFQTMPTYKTNPNQSELFSHSPTAVWSWPGSKHHTGLTFGKHWVFRRMWPWSMK